MYSVVNLQVSLKFQLNTPILHCTVFGEPRTSTVCIVHALCTIDNVTCGIVNCPAFSHSLELVVHAWTFMY